MSELPYIVVVVAMLASTAASIGLAVWCWRSVRDLNRERQP